MEELLVLWIVLGFVVCCLFGWATKSIMSNKGRSGGFWLGFILGLIGIIIALALSDQREQRIVRGDDGREYLVYQEKEEDQSDEEDVFICAKCGNQIFEDESFCSHCGTPKGASATEDTDGEVEQELCVVCPRCGCPVSESEAVCSHCGANLEMLFIKRKAEMIEDEKPEVDAYEADEQEEGEEDDVYVICPHCGVEIFRDQKFCPYCGAPRADKDDA